MGSEFLALNSGVVNTTLEPSIFKELCHTTQLYSLSWRWTGGLDNVSKRIFGNNLHLGSTESTVCWTLSRKTSFGESKLPNCLRFTRFIFQIVKYLKS